MISLKVIDINNFMNQLLLKDTFDNFLICDSEIVTFNIFTINGRINKKFFSDEEKSSFSDDFSYWKDVKHIAFQIIKGNKVPSKMKIVFALSKSEYKEVIEKSGMIVDINEIGGLYIHILYENNSVEIITGTSLNTFTMDKTLDKYWDNVVKEFFVNNFKCELL